MKISSRFSAAALALVATVALAACGHKAVTQTSSATDTVAASAGGTVLVKAGTKLFGKLEAPINTKVAKDGDTFAIDASDSMFYKNPAALKGAVIQGHLTGVQKAGMGKGAKLTLVFDTIKMADGTTAPADVSLASLKAFHAKSHHLRTMGMVIGGAIAGHMAAGKHHGGMLGAAGGYALSQEMKTDIVVPAGTVLTVKFLKDAVSGAAASAAPASSSAP